MRKFKFKITRGLKALMLAAAVLVTGASLTSKNGSVIMANTTFAFLGLGAALKKQGVELDENTEKFVKGLDDVISKALEGKIDQKALDKGIEKFAEDNADLLSAENKKQITDLIKTVKDQAAEIQKLKDDGLTSQSLTLGGAIKAALTEKSEQIKEFARGELKSLQIEVKASQSTADIADHTIGMRVSGIGQQPVRQPLLDDLFFTVNTNLEFIKYIDQETVVRDAKNVATIEASTHNTKITWKERNIQITKVRDFIYLPQDMLDDYDFVEGEVRKLITTSVDLKVDRGLLLDDGNAPNLHSVNEISSEFDAANTMGGTITPWAGTVQEPNMFDLAIAMASHIVMLGQDNKQFYMPDTVLWNSLDKYKNMLVKDENNNYLLPPFVVKVGNTEYSIDNMKVRTSPIVPANKCYVFDSTKATKYVRKGIVLELARENRDQFETEQVTLKAYRRLNLLIRKVDQNAFMKCSDVTATLGQMKIIA